MDNSVKEVIDNRLSTVDTKTSFSYRLSTIDAYTENLKAKLKDESLGWKFVGKALNRLGESQVNDIAEYALDKATSSAGHLFVRICVKAMREKAEV
jgi:hypothetical protein